MLWNFSSSLLLVCIHVLASSLVGVNKTDMGIFSGIIFTFNKLQKGEHFSKIAYMKPCKKF